MRKYLIGAVLACLCSTPAAAQFLSGTEISGLIGGKRIYLATSYGVEFPMQYSRNGRVTGDGTGTGLGKYFTPKETGKWWVAGNRMCQQFPTWYDGRRLCFKLRKTGDSMLDWQREDGQTGTARISG